MYLRPHPSRSPSSDRTSFTRRVSPSVPPLSSRAPHVPHQSFVSPVPTRDVHSRRSHGLPRSLPTVLVLARVIPLSPTACLRSSLTLFFPPYLPFFLNTPPSRRVIFIICYLLRHTPPAVAAAVTATAGVCPARPTRKNRKIEENKSGQRGTPLIPRGGALGRRWRWRWRYRWWRGDQGGGR